MLGSDQHRRWPYKVLIIINNHINSRIRRIQPPAPTYRTNNLTGVNRSSTIN